MDRQKAHDRGKEWQKAWAVHAAAAAKATLLINGGAATAILAFMSKSESAFSLRTAAISLILYALGVSFGVWTLYALSVYSAWNTSYWEKVADAAGGEDDDDKQTVIWERKIRLLMMGSIGFFIAASVALGAALIGWT